VGARKLKKSSNTVLKTARQSKIAALIYVGDAMEENIDDLCHQAGQLALLGTKIFVFQEGQDPHAREAFQALAKITKGGYFVFDARAPDKVRQLLRAVAAYASGGIDALESRQSQEARLLLEQMR
jgi:hypothetical protein